ncbi:replication protein [Pectobacterium aroidearum]|uniref:replication protein n=1 Tax=Pectobacterium aroidearum TaxID=1201031 RepID=UPI00301984AA
MNTAEVIRFPGPEPGQEKRVADIDDGYTRIANEMLEAIASADLTARQLKVMLAYVRKTYGFNKKTDRIADEQISQVTGLSRQNVNKAKRELLSMNCLLLYGSKIGVNKEVSAWQFSKCLQVSNFVSKSETKSVSKLETVEVSSLETHKRHSLKTQKDNINKPPIVPHESKPKQKSKSLDATSADIPEWLPAETWLSWIAYRRDIGKPIKSQQTITQAINVLSKSRDMGYAPEEIINQSIASGWIGLFPPKQPNRAAPATRPTENFAAKNYGSTETPSWLEG